MDALSLSKSEQDMLAAHLVAPDHILSATEVALAAGYQTYRTANSAYGKLGRRLSEELEWVPSEKNAGKTVWTYALATDADKVEREAPGGCVNFDGIWRWKLRPEVAEALMGRADR